MKTREQLLAEADQWEAKAQMNEAYMRAMERTTERTHGRLGHLNNPLAYAAHAKAAADKRQRAADLRAKGNAMKLSTDLYSCDHGHQTTGQVRLLPLVGGGYIFACRQHYEVEMQFRRTRITEGVEYDLPAWDDLTPYTEE